MTAPASPPPGVYRSRSRVTRDRLALAAAGLALVLLGYLIGRLQGGPDAPAVAAAPSAAPSPVAATASAQPPSEPSPPPTTPAPGGTDAYSVIQAEAASGQQGTQVQETEDTGGGQNVGWIGDGDWLRFDDVDFGDQPATTFVARVAADTDDDGGRMEVHLDSPGNDPAGTLEIKDTGGWQAWISMETEITPTTGRHTVFLTFGRDGDGEFVNVNHVRFAH